MDEIGIAFNIRDNGLVISFKERKKFQKRKKGDWI